jgi:acyl-[acyl carrier protein]--UDP-N-acetylglucosamine O-acyltransferase
LNGLNHEMNNRNSQYRYSISDIRKTYKTIYHDDEGKTKPCKIGIIGANKGVSKDE